MLETAGPTGLLPEQYDPFAERGLGNHPQAYSHLGLIRCALLLGRHDHPQRRRSAHPVRLTSGSGARIRRAIKGAADTGVVRIQAQGRRPRVLPPRR